MSRSIFLLISVISSEGGRHYNSRNIDAVYCQQNSSQTLFLSERRYTYSAVF